MKPVCPFCFSEKNTSSYLPDTFFNNKKFTYLKCKDCRLHFVFPFPNAADFEVIYPPSYQSGINSELCEDLSKKISGIRFSYGLQFDLIRKFAPGKKILDYGCGAANFLINANHNGFQCDGTEYNPKHIEVLRKEVPASSFFTIDDFFMNKDVTYDVIRLSNVLEHLTNPREITEKLVSKLNPGGILLVEGPIETNHTLALRVRQVYFNLSKRLRKNRIVSHPPTHIFFANSKNQRNFFHHYPLDELYFKLDESEWPFPENLSEAKGPGGIIKFFIARFSMLVRPLSKNWGNTFIYIGKRK
ncbi:MAG: class I SAM-dependent methyltransferase [Bacteroidia bacterium]